MGYIQYRSLHHDAYFSVFLLEDNFGVFQKENREIGIMGSPPTLDSDVAVSISLLSSQITDHLLRDTHLNNSL